MSRSARPGDVRIADGPADISISGREMLAKGFRPYERYRVPIDAALVALAGGALHNGPLIVTLQWLALNRAHLGEIVRTGSVAR
jgi:hypothetical protein